MLRFVLVALQLLLVATSLAPAMQLAPLATQAGLKRQVSHASLPGLSRADDARRASPELTAEEQERDDDEAARAPIVLDGTDALVAPVASLPRWSSPSARTFEFLLVTQPPRGPPVS